MTATRSSTSAIVPHVQRSVAEVASTAGAENAYIEPEILRFEKGTVERFINAEPRLKVYRFYLEDIARRAAHTLSAAEEKLLADAGPLASTASGAYNIFANADFPFPTITLSDGQSVKLDQANFAVPGLM